MDRSSPSSKSPTRSRRPLIELDAWNAVVKALQLSRQQARIVSLIISGLRDKQIAEELGLSVPTVRTYLSRIFVRVGVHDRVGLVVQVFVIARDLADGRDCHRP